MGLVKSINNFVKKSASTVSRFFVSLTSSNSTLIGLLGNDYRFGTQSRDFLLKAYGQNPYVFMVIDRICQRAVNLKRYLINSREEIIEDPEFIEFLNDPNPKEKFNSLYYRILATYLAAGEVFLIRKQTLQENDQYFCPVNYNVTINETTEGQVISYYVTTFGRSETYLPNEVLHIYKPDITLDTNHGFSTLRATRKVWESNNEVWSTEASLHRNKGISGVLYSEGGAGNAPMTATEKNELQSEYDRNYTGSDNFGKVKVSTSKLGYIQMGMNPNDLKSIETRLEHLRTICSSYNVDSKLFGDSASSTYNNMAEAQRAMIINAVLPLVNLVLPQIITFIARSQFKTLSAMVNEDTIEELQLTKDQQSARLGREVIQGILTSAQAREMLYPELVVELEEGQESDDSKEGDVIEEDSEAARQNAQAQANLRGSVAGVQGILEIQQSVQNGVTSRDSALVILMSIYGFDEETANEILGQ